MDRKQYDKAHHRAEDSHNKVRDLIDDANHHLGRELLELSHRLTQDIKSQKNPRSLEASVKQLEQLLLRIRAGGDEIMDFRHIDMLVQNYRGLISDLRKFENY